MECHYEHCTNPLSRKTEWSIKSGKQKTGFCSKECKLLNKNVGLATCQASGCYNLVYSGTHVFCSHSCSAKTSNTARGKGRLKVCITCGSNEPTSAKGLCNSCGRRSQQNSASIYFDHTIDGKFFKPSILVADVEIKHKHPKGNALFNALRYLTRKYAKYVLPQDERSCMICGYDFYTELCHVTPLKDLPETTSLDDALSFKNVAALCPNCHKELDLNELSITIEVT